MLAAIAHVLTIESLLNAILHALHIRGVSHVNVDAHGAHRGWVETRHWLITIRWKS